MQFDKAEYQKLFEELLEEERIKESYQLFKIRLFQEKAENSF